MSADKAEKQANDGEADDKPIPSLFATIHFKSDERPDGYTAEDIAELNEKANAGGGTSSKPMDWRWIAGAGVGVLIAVCAVAVGLSPTWMPGRIVRAAEAGDRAALERLIDFAAVRSSLETDMKDLMASFYRRELASTGDAFAMMFSGLGMSVIDVSAKSMAEQIATPLSLEKAVSGEDVWVDVMGEPRNFLPEFRHRGGDYAGFSVEGRYLSFSKYEYRLRSRDTDRAFDVQMRRTGPLSWRIDRVRVDASIMTSIQSEGTQASSAVVASSVQPAPVPMIAADPAPIFQPDQPYRTFRAELLRQGFVTVPQERPETNYFCGNEYLDEGDPDLCAAYPEVEDCGSSGMRPCTFIFRRMADGRQLSVATVGELFDRITVTGTEWRN